MGRMSVCRHVLELLCPPVEFLQCAQGNCSCKINAHHPEKLSFHTLNFCLIVVYVPISTPLHRKINLLASQHLKFFYTVNYLQSRLTSRSQCALSKFFFLYCVGLLLIKALLLYSVNLSSCKLIKQQEYFKQCNILLFVIQQFVIKYSISC